MELGPHKDWGASNSSASVRPEDHLHWREVRPGRQAVVSLGLISRSTGWRDTETRAENQR